MLAVKAPHRIKATIRYVVKGERCIFPAERAKSYWPGDDHEVMVTDLRSLEELPSIERHGFALLREPTAVRDCLDPVQIERVLFPEALALAKRLNSAAHAIAFGPVARCDSPDNIEARQPAFGAHVDYGRRTIEAVARPLLGAQADFWLGKWLVLMNLWRPIPPSIARRSPCATPRPFSPRICTTVRSAGGLDDPDRPPLSGYNLSYNPDHRWYYRSRMQPEELFAFRLYDSDSPRAQWTGHTAIDDPEAPEGAPPRQSMEIRTISFI